MINIMNQYKSRFKIIAVTCALLGGGFISSCGDDDKEPVERTYGVDGIDVENGDCIELFVAQPGQGISNQKDGILMSKCYNYTIRTGCHWMIVPKTEGAEEWVKFLSTEGDRDSQFWFAVKPNDGFFTRTADFSIVLDGVEQSKTFIHIEQAPTLPTLSLESNIVNLPSEGGSIEVKPTTNTGVLDYTIEYVDGDGWLKIDEEQAANGKYIFSAEKNNGEDEREAKVTFASRLFPEMKVTASLIQVSYTLVSFEDFSALNFTASTNIWESTGERPIEQWTGNAAAIGWAGLLQGTRTASNVNGRKGFVVTGASGRSGAIMSPAFANLGEETSDVTVTFDCVGYVSNTGVRDYSDLYVAITGPGQLEGATEDLTVNFKQLGGSTVLKVNHIEVKNFPNLPVGVFPAGYDEWNSANARLTYRINGATAETRVILMGGYWENARNTNKYDNPDPVSETGVTYRRNNRNNRLGFDNFKVVRIVK